MEKQPLKILFLCYGNSCRSILAEALARHLWGSGKEVSSAGLAPLGYVSAHTLEVLREAGIPTDGLKSKGLGEVPLRDIDYVVDLTGMDVRGFIPPAFSGKLISIYISDPFGRGLDEFRRTRDELKKLVTEKLPELISAEDFS